MTENTSHHAPVRFDASPTKLQTMLAGTPFSAYVYSYPHKTAYRMFAEPRSLETMWANEDKTALHLYVHIPFCEMRCGFCNLFTAVTPGGDLIEEYLEALHRQITVVSQALGDARFARLSIGGGTPTHLPTRGLAKLFDQLEGVLGVDMQTIPVSIECSPETATQEKLALLRARGVDRISMGVQSFLDEEAKLVHRRQDVRTVKAVLDRMNALAFPTVNVDLMYGLPDQTQQSWLRSIDEALTFQPAEIFLYPLYVRPLTRMGASQQEWDDERLSLYRLGREHLIERGYLPISMRMFRRQGAPARSLPPYRNVKDGMVGLGCGARSYTSSVHYSSAYAVGPKRVKQIIRDYVQTPSSAFAKAYYGIELPFEEHKRRHVILALLSEESCARGLELAHYQARFGAEVLGDFPELSELIHRGLARMSSDRLSLTPRGVERSDLIGAWLFSSNIQALMEGYQAA